MFFSSLFPKILKLLWKLYFTESTDKFCIQKLGLTYLSFILTWSFRAVSFFSATELFWDTFPALWSLHGMPCMHSVPPTRLRKPYILVGSWSSIYSSSVSFELSTWIYYIPGTSSIFQPQSELHVPKNNKKKKITAPNTILGAGWLIIYGQGTVNMDSKFQIIALHPAGQEMHEYTHLTSYSKKF